MSAKILAFLPVLLLFSHLSFGGGPYNVVDGGIIPEWDNTSAIDYHPESGSCGPFKNSDMLTKLQTEFAKWTDLTETDVTFNEVTSQFDDIDGDNYETYLVTGSGTTNDTAAMADGYNPIVFDDDGEITAAFAGEANVPLILGFAGITGYSSDYNEITDGQLVLNCKCLENHPVYLCSYLGSYITSSEETLNATIVHEMGHFLNLDHSQANYEYYDNGNVSDDAYVPIMHPILIEADSGYAPRKDDIHALAYLYPAEDFQSSRCLVTGTVLDTNGDPLRCVDVWATTDDATDTISWVTGTTATAYDNNEDGDTLDTDECEENCGYFNFYLETGKAYSFHLKAIDSDFVGGSGIGPCADYIQNTSITDSDTDEPVASITSAQCTAGSTIDLGDISTSYSPLASNDSSSSDSSDSSSSSDSSDNSAGGSEGDVENPVGYWCKLNPRLQIHKSFSGEFLFIFMIALLLFIKKRTSTQ